MKRIALFAVLTCLFALWQFPGISKADDGIRDCPAGVCPVSTVSPLPVGRGPGAVALPPDEVVVVGAKFPKVHNLLAKLRHPLKGRLAIRGCK